MELPADVQSQLKRVPGRHREDATQEAWLAMYEGRDPLRVVQNFMDGELRHEERERTEQMLESLPKEERVLDWKYAVKSWLDTVHGKADESEEEQETDNQEAESTAFENGQQHDAA